jgi:hypothetical protein
VYLLFSLSFVPAHSAEFVAIRIQRLSHPSGQAREPAMNLVSGERLRFLEARGDLARQTDEVGCEPEEFEH